MTRKSYIVAGLLSVTAIGGVAAATQALEGPRGPMRADTNGDGIVSRAEFFAAAEQRFVKRDADNNRVLAGSELTDKRGRFARQDANNDGQVSFAEAAAATQARFARLDTDRDGKLTPEELGPGRRGGPDREAMRGGREGGRGGGSGMLRGADANNDGRITRDEFRAQSDRRFDRLDTNRDGVIDQAEAQAARGPGRGMRGPGGPGFDAPPPPPAPDGDDD